MSVKTESVQVQKTPVQRRHIDTIDNLISIGREAVLPYLGTRVVLVLVGLLADFYILPMIKSDPILPLAATNTQFPSALWLIWQRFDSGFYLGIAINGYWPASTLHTYSNWAFFPLYPMLIYIFGHLFGGSVDAYSLAGLFISNVAGLIAVIYLYVMVRREFGSQVASRTIIFLALFPTSFYLSAVYSESLFLACAIACIYYTRIHRWWLAGFCGGLAALTRVQGVVLLIPVLWEYWQELSDQYAPLPDLNGKTLRDKSLIWLNSRLYGPLLAARRLRNWLSLLALALIPAGLLAFIIYGKIKTGDFLATFHNQQWGWGRYLTSPLSLLIYSIRHPPLRPNPMDWNFWPLNLAISLIFLGLAVWALRKLPMTYALYTVVMVLLPLSNSRINSISRYYLVVFPVFILLALWTCREGNRLQSNAFIMGLFASLQAVFMVFFVLGLPAIA